MKKIKQLTRRKKYIKKNNKKVKTKKYAKKKFFKKIYKGGELSSKERTELYQNYTKDMNNIVNKVQNSLSKVSSANDLKKLIDSVKKSYDPTKITIYSIIEKYICPLLINDNKSKLTDEDVFNEVNQYIEMSKIDLSKTKIPNLPKSIYLMNLFDIVDVFINKYPENMVIVRYLEVNLKSIDNTENINQLIMILNIIYHSNYDYTVKYQLYKFYLFLYKEEIKKHDELKNLVNMIIILSTQENTYEFINFIVEKNPTIKEKMNHVSLKDIILSNAKNVNLKITRSIPVYIFWNSLFEEKTGMNIFDFKRAFFKYISTTDNICSVIREKLPGFSFVDTSVIIDEYPYCFGFILISIISYIVRDSCSFLIKGGKSIQLALYDKYINNLDIDTSNSDGRSKVVDLIYNSYVDLYKSFKTRGREIDTSFYTTHKGVEYSKKDPSIDPFNRIIKTKINTELEFVNKQDYENFIYEVKNIIYSRYKSYDIDTTIVLKLTDKSILIDELSRKTQEMARNIALLIEWLSEENNFLKFKYHNSRFSPTYKITYLSENKIREKIPSEGDKSEESKLYYYDNNAEYQMLTKMEELSEEDKNGYENAVNENGEKKFRPMYFTEIIDIGYKVDKTINLSSIQNVELKFDGFNGLVEYQKLEDIVEEKIRDVNITYKDSTKPNEIYYKNKAIKQLNTFEQIKFEILYKFINLIENSVAKTNK